MNFHEAQAPVIPREELERRRQRAKKQSVEERIADLEDYIFCLKAEIAALWAKLNTKADAPNRLGPGPNARPLPEL